MKKLCIRHGFTIIILGGASFLGMKFTNYDAYVLLGSIILGLWLIIRNTYLHIYLSQWHVRVSEDAITISKNGNGVSQYYNEMCWIQNASFSIMALIMHLVHRPRSEHIINDVTYQFAVPVGFEVSHVLRRFWTISSDLIIQSRSGVAFLIPLSALNSSERRELWLFLRTKRPDLFSKDQDMLKKAMEEEKKGDELAMAQKRSDAYTHHKTAAELWEKAGNMDSVERCLRHMVECLLSLGRYSESAGLAVRALELSENLAIGFERRVQQMADNLNNLASAEYRVSEQKGLKTAIEYLNRAKELYSEIEMPFMECRMLSNQAIIEEQLFILTGDEKHLKNCDNFAQEAMNIIETQLRNKQNVNIRMQKANILGSMARVDFYRSNWERAENNFKKASDISELAKKIIIDDISMWGRALFKLSQYKSKSDTDRLRLLNQAMEKLDTAVRYAQANGRFDETILVYMLRGDTFWDMGNLEAAVHDYKTVISLLERSRFVLARPFDRTAILRRCKNLYAKTVEALLRLADKKNAPELIDESFQYCEFGKARNLAELLSLTTTLLLKIPDALREEYKTTEQKQRLAYLNIETMQKQGDSGSQDLSKQAWEQLQKAQQDYERIYAQVIKAVPEFADLTSPKVPTLSEIQSWLPLDNRTGVLEFCVGENSLCVFIITRKSKPIETCFTIDGLGYKEIEEIFLKSGFLRGYDIYASKAQEVELLRQEYFELICKYSDLKGKNKSNPKEFERKYRFRLKSLEFNIYRKTEDTNRKGCYNPENLDILQLHWIRQLPNLIETIREKIFCAISSKEISIFDMIQKVEIEKLTIIPDGILHRLPLHTAIDKSVVTYAPSSLILTQTIAKCKGIPESAFIVANPDHRIGKYDYGMEAAEYEARLIENRLNKKRLSVLKIMQDKATIPAIIKYMPNYSWFHFCGHAHSDFNSPLESHLKVTGIDKGLGFPDSWESRFLRAKKITAEGTVQTGAWIVLTACESGVSPPDPSGEYLGLPSAFLSAGASIVISSLWEVHVGTPIVVMDRFYENILEKNHSVAFALKDATGNLRSLTFDEIGIFEDSNGLFRHVILTPDEKERFPPSHPFHWAPFTVCGAGWFCDEVPSDAMDIGSHKLELLKIPAHVGVGTPSEANKVINDSVALIKSGQISQAISMLEEALKEWDDIPSLYGNLCTAYDEIGNYDKALQYGLEAIKYDPNNFLSFGVLGWIYVNLGDIGKARDYYKRELELNPTRVQAMIGLSELTNDPIEALEYLDQALLIDPDDKELQEGRMMWQELINDPQLNISAQRLMWAQQAFDKGKLGEVRMHIAMARQEAMNNELRALSYRIESDTLRKEEKLSDSIIALENAVKYDPMQPSYWNNLAARRILLLKDPKFSQIEKMEILEKSEKESLKAISIKDYARPHQNLAIVYYNFDLLAKSKEHATQSFNMAKQQIKTGPTGELVCKGCPTEGKIISECKGCIQKAQGILRDIELLSGDYTMKR